MRPGSHRPRCVQTQKYARTVPAGTILGKMPCGFFGKMPLVFQQDAAGFSAEYYGFPAGYVPPLSPPFPKEGKAAAVAQPRRTPKATATAQPRRTQRAASPAPLSSREEGYCATSSSITLVITARLMRGSL